MQPADIARMVTVSGPRLAPDGLAVAVTVQRVDRGTNTTRSAIWLVPTGDGPPRQLTAGPGDGGARFSPDGERLAFARRDDGGEGGPATFRLLVMPLDGPGEAVTVASSPEAITSVEWSPDAQRLAWCTRVREPGADDPDRDREPRRIDTLFSTLDNTGWTIDRRSQVMVGRLDGTEDPRPVTAGPYEHHEVHWSPDGRSLVVVAARHDGWDLDLAVDLWLVDPDGPADQEGRRLTDGTREWTRAAWSPDGTRVAGTAFDLTAGWRNARPLVVDVGSGATVDAAPGVDRTFAPYPAAPAPVWVDDDTLLVAREDRGRVGLLRAAADGSRPAEEVLGGDRVVVDFDATAKHIAFTATTVDRPGELFLAAAGAERRLTQFTRAFLRACPPQPVERFTVPSPAGDGNLDAWFVQPTGWRSDDRARWPLLVSIHGGPMTQYGEQWFDEFHLWAGAGFAVVATNPHGSSGREDAFVRATRSPLAEVDPGTGWGGIDADDVVAVLQATLARWPALDPARVGVLGGSYGGYLTSWLLARTGHFAAGCSERAANNLLSLEWSTDIKGSFAAEFGVDPLDHPEEYLRMSPAAHARDLTAPVLILHSEDDLRCNVEQADALFVPLRKLGRPVEYWRFPGEGHELSRSGSPRHRIRRAELIIDFFQRHLS
jgi:dipeptidyl aminopeptidase/acylaminoacyl peptidase